MDSQRSHRALLAVESQHCEESLITLDKWILSAVKGSLITLDKWILSAVKGSLITLDKWILSAVTKV